MKVSKVRTDYVLVAAFSNNEGDGCDFAIFDIGPKALGKMSVCISATCESYISSLEEFEGANFFYNIEGYYRYNNVAPRGMIAPEIAGRRWVFVDTTPEEIEDLEIPDGDIGYQCLHVLPGRSFRFSAIADDTDTRFETSTIHFDELIKSFA